jgi:Cdc6-like AAA superfamily ATPase
MSDFYVPRTKTELVDWLHNRFHGVSFKGYNKKQLYAIYFKCMKEAIYGRETRWEGRGGG